MIAWSTGRILPWDSVRYRSFVFIFSSLLFVLFVMSFSFFLVLICGLVGVTDSFSFGFVCAIREVSCILFLCDLSSRFFPLAYSGVAALVVSS